MSSFHYGLSLSHIRYLVWVLPCIEDRHDTTKAAAVTGLQSGCFLLSLTGFGPQTKGWKHMSHPCVQNTAYVHAHTQTQHEFV